MIPWGISSVSIKDGLCLLMMLVVVVCPVTTDGWTPRYEGCILKLSNYLDDYLLVTWTLPVDYAQKTNTSNINISASWQMEENVGTCSEVTMTSCKMIRRDKNSMNFAHDFYLTVTIVTKDSNVTTNWRINTTDCRQPPKIDNVSAIALNSSCIHISWEYTNAKAKYGQYCIEMLSKSRIYRIQYKESHSRNSTWILRYVGPTNTCSGDQVVCGLIPYTFYDVEVDCRLVINNGKYFGHWSETNTILTKTEEDVPSVSPETTEGGFSYVRKDCEDNKIRSVHFYWKTIPAAFRNGKILGYEINIYNSKTPTRDPEQTYTVHGDGSVTSSTNLLCSSSYIVTLSAFTSKGPSKTPSSISIPEYKSVLDLALDVVPVLVNINASLNIKWVLKGNVTFNIASVTVYLCLKTITGTCQSSLNWTELSGDRRQYSLLKGALPQPLYKYVFGISVQSTNTSSGIIWTNCIYSGDKDVVPPKNVRVMTGSKEGSLHVHWDKPSCDGPYIRQYVVHLCPVKEAALNNCSEPLYKIVDGHESSVQLDGLDPAVQYEVSVQAVTLSNITSVFSKAVSGRPFVGGSTLRWWQIGLIVLLCLLVLGAMAIVTVQRIRYFRWRLNQRAEITDLLAFRLPSESHRSSAETESICSATECQ